MTKIFVGEGTVCNSLFSYTFFKNPKLPPSLHTSINICTPSASKVDGVHILMEVLPSTNFGGGISSPDSSLPKKPHLEGWEILHNRFLDSTNSCRRVHGSIVLLVLLHQDNISFWPLSVWYGTPKPLLNLCTHFQGHSSVSLSPCR